MKVVPVGMNRLAFWQLLAILLLLVQQDPVGAVLWQRPAEDASPRGLWSNHLSYLDAAAESNGLAKERSLAGNRKMMMMMMNGVGSLGVKPGVVDNGLPTASKKPKEVRPPPPKETQGFGEDQPSRHPSDSPSIVPSGLPTLVFLTTPTKKGDTEPLGVGAVKPRMMMMMMRKQSNAVNRPGELSDFPSMVPSDQPSSLPSDSPSLVVSYLPTIDIEPANRRRLTEISESDESRWLDTDPLFVKVTPPNRVSPTSTDQPTESPVTVTSTAAPTLAVVTVSDAPSDLPSLAPSERFTSLPTIVDQNPAQRRRLSESTESDESRWLDTDPLFVKVTPPNQLSSTSAPTQAQVKAQSEVPSDVPSLAPSSRQRDATSILPTVEAPTTDSETDPLFVKVGPPSQAIPSPAPTVALPRSSVPSDFPSDAPSLVPDDVSSAQPVAALTVKSFTLRSRQTEEMDQGTVSEFETACGKEFFPAYLPLIHKAYYEDLQCSVHSQSVIRNTDSRSLPEESLIEVTTGNVAIVMKVSAKAIRPPPRDFNVVVATTLESYSKEFQQLLSDRTSYFESAEQPQTVPSVQHAPTTSSQNDSQRTMVVIVAVCCCIVTVSLLAVLLAAKGRRSRGPSPEAMATLVNDGVANEIFSTGSHRKSLDVEGRESHSSISSSATSPLPVPSEKIFALGFPEHVLLNVPRETHDSGVPRSMMRANRMYSFSTGVCSNESDLFDRSYKNEGGSSVDESTNGIGLVESSTTGSRVSEDFDDVAHFSTHWLMPVREEGQHRFAWTRKIFGTQADHSKPVGGIE